MTTTSPPATSSPPTETPSGTTTFNAPVSQSQTDTASVLILGPLTTIFTPPARCSTHTWAICSTCTVQHAFQGIDCEQGDNTECWPHVTWGVDRPEGQYFMGLGVYSPGISCPHGYTAACTSTGGGQSGSGGWSAQFRVQEGETAIGCCPT